MPKCRFPRIRRSFPVALLPMPLIFASVHLLCAEAGQGPPIPDAVCVRVDGAGYVSAAAGVDSTRLRIPASSLTPMQAGDTLVVESGTIEILDVRTGQDSVLGAGTTFVVPDVHAPQGSEWWRHLEDSIVRSLSAPQRARLSKQHRGRIGALWPDGGRFAPGLAVAFEWWSVFPSPAMIRITAGREVLEEELPEGKPGAGVFVWQPPESALGETVTWELLDADGEYASGAEFVILTKEKADSERRRYQKAAEGVSGAPPGFAAAVLAAADRNYLW